MAYPYKTRCWYCCTAGANLDVYFYSIASLSRHTRTCQHCPESVRGSDYQNKSIFACTCGENQFCWKCNPDEFSGSVILRHIKDVLGVL